MQPILVSVNVEFVNYMGLTLTTHAYKDEKGNVQFNVLTSEVADALGAWQEFPSKWLKRLQVKGLVPGKIKALGVDGKTKIHACIALNDVSKVLLALVANGNERARQVMEDMSALTFYQLASDAFGLKFEKEERQEWVDKRLKGKATHRTHTDAIMEWGIRTTGQKPDGKVYADITNGIYIYCFRKTAAELKAEKGVKKGQLLRDFFNPKELSQVEALEQVIMMAIDRGADPYAALAKLSL
jgi:hypothetical protein